MLCIYIPFTCCFNTYLDISILETLLITLLPCWVCLNSFGTLVPSRAENLEVICKHCKNSRACDTHNKVPCLGVRSDKQDGAVNDLGGAEVGYLKLWISLYACVKVLECKGGPLDHLGAEPDMLVAGNAQCHSTVLSVGLQQLQCQEIYVQTRTTDNRSNEVKRLQFKKKKLPS